MNRSARCKGIFTETGFEDTDANLSRDDWLMWERFKIGLCPNRRLGSALFSGMDPIATALVWGCFGRGFTCMSMKGFRIWVSEY